MLGSTITFSLYRYVSQGLTRRTDKYLKCGVAGYSSPGNGATFVAMTTAGVAITASAWTVANLCFFNMESRNHDDEQNYSHFCDNTLLATTGKICLTSNVWLLYPLRSSHPINRTGCDAGLAHSHLLEAMDPEVEDDSGYTEAERFSQCLDYHRSLLLDYCRRWPSGPETGSPSNVNECHILSKNNTNNHVANNSLSAQKWPRNVPRDDEVSALECDLGYAERSTMYRQEPKSCHDAKFRLASNYLSQTTNTEEKRQRGFCIIKELAEQGHPDSMCYYGVLLNEGLTMGLENVSTQDSATWWWRCVIDHRHIQATYELATAYYLGEGGVPENITVAVSLFRRAANLGHAGAAYILGECLLYGAPGVDIDRANALEWLVTAAELGHRVARERVILVLTNQDYNDFDECLASGQRKQEEDAKWINPHDDEAILKAVNIERRYTIGGESRNSAVPAARRKTIVSESRDES